MTSESDLIEMSKNGDKNAFSKLIRRYEDRIYSLSHHVCATAPNEAADVYQETFITAFKKLGQFRKNSELGTWLYRIASNLCFMRFRKQGREKWVPLVSEKSGDHDHPGTMSVNSLPSLDDDPFKQVRKKELQQAIQKALGTLPIEYRLVLILKDIQGLSNDDIAKTLQLSLPAVKSRLHRARLLMRDQLSAYVDPQPR